MVPNSASTQFYICLGEAPHLDRLGFTAFGRVVKGIEVIDKIALGDKIRQAKLAK
jgi:cyclophilin family peptidyl-prolyl cis-trans isomerase